MPVIIVERDCIKTFEDNIDSIRLIPFSSLGNENSVLIGFKPDSIKVYYDDNYFEKEAFIGIYNGHFCLDSNEYNAIIGI